MSTRLEYDSIGCLEVPSEAYYGVQSLRAKRNFPITGQSMHPALVTALAEVKKAAAVANRKTGELPQHLGKAIEMACDDIVGGGLRDEFIVDAVQGGAGTSANMNANEVIANRALELLGYGKGDYAILHPNDHVNLSQSTNDVYPTAGRIAVIRLLSPMLAQLERLSDALEEKAETYAGVLRMGRTQLQDAVPISFDQAFMAYRTAILRDVRRLKRAQKELCIVNLGGTAIGTGLNAGSGYLLTVVDCLRQVTGLPLRQAGDLIDATQNLDDFVYVSGVIKACAVSLSKMANDLRLLSSGPRTGIGELSLPAMQNGSSIMPGKVNPVIPEVVTQVAFGVIGNDMAITLAAESGQLELNAFEPILFSKLFESIETLSAAAATFTDNCVKGISVHTEACLTHIRRSVGCVTALCPVLGYHKAAELAKKALRTDADIRSLVLEEGLLTESELNVLLDPALLAHPHSHPCYQEVHDAV